MWSVARYDSAPELDVDPALPDGGLRLDPEVLGGGGGRETVERHVHQGRHSSSCSSLGSGPECKCGEWEEIPVVLQHLNPSQSVLPGSLM